MPTAHILKTNYAALTKTQAGVLDILVVESRMLHTLSPTPVRINPIFILHLVNLRKKHANIVMPLKF